MALRNIIVLGASAGPLEALKRIVPSLPPDLEASVFIVRHMAPHIRGVLPQMLNRAGSISAGKIPKLLVRRLVRQAVLSYEQLSKDTLRAETGEPGGDLTAGAEPIGEG